ncbi:MAG TPA: type I-E CRISPR-associated protein Cse2/CasB [Deltaproteobacteria bacterium]|nr:MAG: type I-E CRISPR-associated protein Cse2/CasB [Deltaproteobacteria bacterium CG_4_10_14_0_8_um_filter_43_12]HCX89033.1 type I-E CRISPR-associated protein Cse2/CasB [Deltaproteobacteria bacterium]
MKGGYMSTSYLRFDKDSPEQQALVVWWRELDNNYRGERAALRRSAALAEVAFSPAYHRLRLAVGRFGAVDYEGLALVAGLAARVKKIDGEGSTIAEQMATGKIDGSARVSGLRFRRLLKVKEHEALFTSMTRIIALLGGNVNLQSLAQSVYFWNDITRKNWAFEYYSKATNEA